VRVLASKFKIEHSIQVKKLWNETKDQRISIVRSRKMWALNGMTRVRMTCITGNNFTSIAF